MRQALRPRQAGKRLPRRLFLVLLATLLAVTMAPEPVRAQALPGGVLFDWPVYSYLNRPQWELELGYNYDLTERRRPQGTTRDASQSLTEGFRLVTGGWLYHPALTHYTLTAAPRWQQIEEDFGSGTNNHRRFNLNYDIDGMLLPYKPYALRYYAGQSTGSLTSSRARETTVDSTRYGLSTKIPSKILPSTIAYRHLETVREGRTTVTERWDRLGFDSRYTDPRQKASLLAVYNQRQRDTGGKSFMTENANARLTHDFNLTEDRRLALKSNLLGGWSATAAASSHRFSLREELSWRLTHRPNLSSAHNANFEYQQTDGSRYQSYGVNSSLSHRLYENLTTSPSLSASRSVSENRDTNMLGGQVNFSYGRRLPFLPKGFLTLQHGQGYNARLEDGAANTVAVETIVVIEEFLTLEQSMIVIDSVVVDTPDGSQTFLRDVDYRLITVGAWLEIRRIDEDDGGAILAGDAVRIRYVYEAQAGYDAAIHTYSYGGSLNMFESLTLYARFAGSKESFLGGVRPASLAETTSTAAGASWEIQRQRYRLATRYDYTEVESSTGSSTSSHRVSPSASLTFGRDLTVAVAGSYSQTETLQTGSDSESYGLSTNLRWQMGSQSSLALNGSYLETRSNLPTRRERYAFSSTFQRSLGIWNLVAKYKYSEDLDPLEDREDTRHGMSLLLRRALW